MSLMQLSAAPRMRRPVILAAAAVVAASLTLAACNESTAADTDRIEYGTAVALGKGTARTYVQMHAGAPAEIGVALSEAALTDLPAGTNHGDGPHSMFNEYLLELPAAAGATQFKFVELDWNPMGHEPDGVYTLPHFDFHFYSIPVAERNAIDPTTDAQYAAHAGNLPAAEFAPPGYLAASVLAGAPPELAAVPRMGMHWLDPNSEELHGAVFSKTFIYGSWNGKLIFAEPMITKAYLETKPNFSAALAVPARSALTGLRPTTQRIYWNEATKEYRVALGGLSAPAN